MLSNVLCFSSKQVDLILNGVHHFLMEYSLIPHFYLYLEAQHVLSLCDL